MRTTVTKCNLDSNTMTTNDEVLQLLSKEYLENILQLLKKTLPNSIRDHHYLYFHLKNYDLIEDATAFKNLSVACKAKFYGPKNGLINNCTYIAITEQHETDYWIFLSTQETNGKELLDCLTNTKLINWLAEPIYFSCDKKYLEQVYAIGKSKHHNWIIEEPENIYYLPKNVAKAFVDEKIPKLYKIKQLQVENTKIIDDNWSHKYAGSYKLIESSIILNGGLGLFNEKNEMITWMVTNELMSPGFLTVIDSERRKGYATIITKQEFKRFAQVFDIDVCVRVIDGNEASTGLMKKLGCNFTAIEMWIGRPIPN